MGAQISRRMRIDRGFGTGNHKCPSTSQGKPIIETNGSIRDKEIGENLDQKLTLSGQEINSSAAPPPRVNGKGASSSLSFVNASAAKIFNFSGDNVTTTDQNYTISKQSTLSNHNTKIILSWLKPNLTNQAMPSIDCDISKSPSEHLNTLMDLINETNDIYVSYTENYHIKLLLSGDLCDNIHLVAKNKLVMNLSSVEIASINKDLKDKIVIIQDYTDDYKSKKKEICQKMTEYFTEKMQTFAKIILIMNYCYLKLNSIQNGGICFMPPDEGMDDNINLFTPSTVTYNKIEVYDNELIHNSNLLKHIDKLDIRDKLILPAKNFTEIRNKVLDGLVMNEYNDKLTATSDPIIQDKINKIITNKDTLTMIEVIHEKQCKTTDGAIFLSNKEAVEYNDLYSETPENEDWLNAYKSLCCSLKDKLTTLQKTFISQSFVQKEIEKDAGKKVSLWADNDEMTKDNISELNITITEEIEKIIIEIDRGFLLLYLTPTLTPGKKVKLEEDVRRGEEAKRQLERL